MCWLFKTDKWTFPDWIYWALLAFVLYFIFDILQALSGALMLKRFLEKHEEMMWEQDDAVSGDQEIEKPRWVDSPAFGCFLLKCVFLITGFVCVGIELMRRINS